MHLVWVISCRDYEVRDDDTVDIEGAGVNTFWVDALPIDLDVRVLMRLALQEDEEGVIEAHFLGPNLTNVQSIDIPVYGDPLPTHMEGFEVHMTQPVEFRFEAQAEGVYSVELFMPDREHVSLFWVVRIGRAPYARLH